MLIVFLSLLLLCQPSQSFFERRSRIFSKTSNYTEPDQHEASIDDLRDQFLQPNDFMLAEITPVEKVNEEESNLTMNPKYFEGDILGIDLSALLQRSALRSGEWPNNEIPYVLEKGMTLNQKIAIIHAFYEFYRKTCIKFYPKRDNDHDYIYFATNVGEGCSSYVGRKGGKQSVDLDILHCFKKGHIVHELMHAIGFVHEQSRTDRDKHVYLEASNIIPGMEYNFQKYPSSVIDSLGIPYDYDSITHYNKFSFSWNGLPTIIPKVEGARIGQREELSGIDVKKINKLYKCSVESTFKSDLHKNYRSNVKTVDLISPTKPQAIKENITAETKTTSEEVCDDFNVHCKTWGELGYCKDSSKYMGQHCRKTCGLCSSETNGTKLSQKIKSRQFHSKQSKIKRFPLMSERYGK